MTIEQSPSFSAGAATMKPDVISAESIALAARRVMDRCDRLAKCSDRPGQIARFFCSPAAKQAHALLRDWMQTAGLTCRLDAAGNLIGQYSPPTATSTKKLLIGSHLDTVADAGRYDGILGVMLGLAIAELAAETGVELPFHVDVIAFSEEEGVRYQTPFIGSRALIGDLSPEFLSRTDAAGISVAEALRAFGCNPNAVSKSAYCDGEVLAYLEPHIEQGPVLEAENNPVGIVTGITGQTRAHVQFIGKAGHAGAVPMFARQDALVAAAVFIAQVEQIARGQPGLVATVGQLEVLPNVSNVIPGEVNLTLDVRHQDDDARDAAFREMTHRAALIAEERGIEFDLVRTQSYRAVKCDERLQACMAQSASQAGVRPFTLPSGAGHDAAILSRRFPVGMLFVRCAGGVSHHPDESVAEADVAVALEVLWRCVLKLAASYPNILAD